MQDLIRRSCVQKVGRRGSSDVLDADVIGIKNSGRTFHVISEDLGCKVLRDLRFARLAVSRFKHQCWERCLGAW